MNLRRLIIFVSAAEAARLLTLQAQTVNNQVDLVREFLS
jgi:hypothetical protein